MKTLFTSDSLQMSCCRFSVSKRADDYGNFFLLVDEETFAYHRIYTLGDIPSGSMTIILELTPGQVVRVQNIASVNVLGSDSIALNSWFTGHLLYGL